MRTLRPHRERCNIELPPDSLLARIYSFECIKSFEGKPMKRQQILLRRGAEIRRRFGKWLEYIWRPLQSFKFSAALCVLGASAVNDSLHYAIK